MVTAGCWRTESAMAGIRNTTTLLLAVTVKVNGGGSDSGFLGGFSQVPDSLPGPKPHFIYAKAGRETAKPAKANIMRSNESTGPVFSVLLHF